MVTLNQAGIQGANTSVYQDTSQSYETLGMTTSRNNEQWDMEKHIYHVLETSTEVIMCVRLLHDSMLWHQLYIANLIVVRISKGKLMK